MAPAPPTEFLHANRVFAAVPLGALHALAAVAREQSYRARELVFAEGEPALFFCIVRTGHVKIVRAGHARRDVVLELLGPRRGDDDAHRARVSAPRDDRGLGAGRRRDDPGRRARRRDADLRPAVESRPHPEVNAAACEPLRAR